MVEFIQEDLDMALGNLLKLGSGEWGVGSRGEEGKEGKGGKEDKEDKGGKEDKRKGEK